MTGYFTNFLAAIGHGLDLQEMQSYSISKLLKHNPSVMLLVVNCGVKGCFTCCDQCYVLPDSGCWHWQFSI